MVNNSVNFWTCQNVPRPQNTFLGLEYDKYGNQVPVFEMFEKYIKYATKKTVQNGSYAFPNELTRFQFEANPIWDKIQKQYKNAVII